MSFVIRSHQRPNFGQILHFLTPPRKIRGRVGESPNIKVKNIIKIVKYQQQYRYALLSMLVEDVMPYRPKLIWTTKTGKVSEIYR